MPDLHRTRQARRGWSSPCGARKPQADEKQQDRQRPEYRTTRHSSSSCGLTGSPAAMRRSGTTQPKPKMLRKPATRETRAGQRSARLRTFHRAAAGTSPAVDIVCSRCCRRRLAAALTWRRLSNRRRAGRPSDRSPACSDSRWACGRRSDAVDEFRVRRRDSRRCPRESPPSWPCPRRRAVLAAAR